MTKTGRRARLTQKMKPRRLVSEISFANDLQGHGASQIDVECFVSDTHRAAPQLDRFPVFAVHQLIMLQASRYQFGLRFSLNTPKKARPIQAPHPELGEAYKPDRTSSLQRSRNRKLGRLRVSSPFMDLNLLRTRSDA